MSDKPDYIEFQWHVRCDGWWRKAIIGAAMILLLVGLLGNIIRFFDWLRN